MDELHARCLQYLDELIRIPSPSGGENEIGAWIEKKFTDMFAACAQTCVVRRVATDDGRFALYAEIPGSDAAAPSVMLAGHIDTVSPAKDWRGDPFVPARDGDKLCGLGSCDMKAGVAVMLSMAEIASRGGAPRGALRFAFVPDEEAYSHGVRALIASGVRADFCLMPEPHFDHAVIGGPGKLLLAVKATGKAAHGARPHEGVNAIAGMARFLAKAEELRFPAYPGMDAQPLVPLSIVGGPEEYSLTVPDECAAVVSKQLALGETKESVDEALRGALGESRADANISWEIAPPYYPPYAIDAESCGVQKFSAIAADVFGHALPLTFGKSVSDANCLVAEAGIPTLIFGPLGGNLHQADEWVSADSIGKCLEVYRRYIFD